ncbi:MAG: protein kinase, partial [Deltaproteobacteria bacterium]|nr:protein kinase [Deltaproteobacteria bacterium]
MRWRSAPRPAPASRSGARCSRSRSTSRSATSSRAGRPLSAVVRRLRDVADELAKTATASSPSVFGRARDSIGPTFGRYVVERELGAGGMGVVYAAFDPDLERRVALKVLREGIADEAEQRLLREARAMARLAHPNVVTVYEVGTAGDRDYVAMELIDGEPLIDWIRAATRSQPAILAAFVEAGRG